MRLRCHNLGSFCRPWLRRNRNNAISSVFSQPFSTTEAASISHVDVPLGLYGSVTLHIRRASQQSRSNPLLIYLPPGPIASSACPSFSSLPSSLTTTVVSINYRASAEHKYPLPIHDVLAGYDWILKHLVCASPTFNGLHSPPTRHPFVAVCGELLGGSLAAMLALTECYAHKVGGIQAVVLGNPIVDWTAMYPPSVAYEDVEKVEPSQGYKRRTEGLKNTVNAKTSKRISKSMAEIDSWTAFSDSTVLSSEALLRARDMLFAQTENYHDPFASPLLFFRTASMDIPADASVNFPSSTTTLVEFIRKRRAHRRHPPLGSGLVLPRCRVDIGKRSVLRDQGLELVEALQRSVDVYEGTGRRQRNQKIFETVTGTAKTSVELREREEEGLWGEDDMFEIMDWTGKTVLIEALCGKTSN